MGGGGGEGWTVRCFVPLMHFCIGKYQSVPRLLATIVDGLKCLHISGTKTQPMAVGPSLYEYKFNLDDKDVATQDTLKILRIVKRSQIRGLWG